MASEAKANKESTNQIKKSDIGQFHDHLAFLQEHYPTHEHKKIMVARTLKVVDQANPPSDLRILMLEEFQNVLDRLLRVIEKIKGSNVKVNPLAASLDTDGLAWPQCLDGLRGPFAIDLRSRD